MDFSAEVTLVSSSNTTLKALYKIAHVCTTPLGKKPEEATEERMKEFLRILLSKKHLSVFEHATLTYYIGGISRPCSLQLARHRFISRTEMSQRYVAAKRLLGEGTINYLKRVCVLPTTFNNETGKALYYRALMTQLERYHRAVETGMKLEDARGLLPEATKTQMYITLNLRTLFELMQKRAFNSNAQQEIRELVMSMWNALPEELKDTFEEALLYLK